MGIKDSKPTGGRGSFSLGDVLLERGKHRDDDIGDVWEEQKRLREQESLLEIEYKQAREKAKQLKTQIKQHKIGDETIFGDDLKKYMPKLDADVIKEPAVQRLKQLKKAPVVARKIIKHRPQLHLSKKQLSLVAVGGVLLIGLVARPLLGNPPADSSKALDTSATLADTTADAATTADLPQVESTEFGLLYPAGVNPGNVKVVKVNPENTATVYAYVDKLEEAQLRISEQRVPASFAVDESGELQKLANSFNAKSVIQIDGTKVYHGKNESGNVKQSLIFIKNDLLIFIASSAVQTDDKWAAYISSFN